MNKKLFQSYVVLDNDIKELEAKKEVLREKLLAEMQTEKADQVKMDQGIFSIQERKTYKYTSKVEKEKKILDELKKKEEESGAAKVTVSHSLRFQATKE